jgi:hypothetical protein
VTTISYAPNNNVHNASNNRLVRATNDELSTHVASATSQLPTPAFSATTNKFVNNHTASKTRNFNNQRPKGLQHKSFQQHKTFQHVCSATKQLPANDFVSATVELPANVCSATNARPPRTFPYQMTRLLSDEMFSLFMD